MDEDNKNYYSSFNNTGDGEAGNADYKNMVENGTYADEVETEFDNKNFRDYDKSNFLKNYDSANADYFNTVSSTDDGQSFRSSESAGLNKIDRGRELSNYYQNHFDEVQSQTRQAGNIIKFVALALIIGIIVIVVINLNSNSNPNAPAATITIDSSKPTATNTTSTTQNTTNNSRTMRISN